MADTKVQEEASLTAFYYGISKGAKITTTKGEPATGLSERDEDLYNALLSVYPTMPDKWYTAFLKQTKVLMEWMDHREGTSDPSYKYGRFGSSNIKSIPRNYQSDLGDWIFDTFGKEHKKLFGSGSGVKDSWNPMDVYMVNGGDIATIKREIHMSCCFGDDRIAPKDETAAKMEIQSLNQYLAHLTKNKTFVGISLKETDRGDPKVTETNLEKGFAHIQHSCGMITKGLHTYMDIDGSKGSNGRLDFKGNSLTYQAKFNIGNVLKKYKYESKISSLKNHATEPRDLVEGATANKFVPAKARNGAVPAPKMAQIVKQYSGEEMNAHIPMNGNFSDGDKSFWVSFIDSIKGKDPKPDLGKFSIHLKRPNKWWDNLSPSDFMNKAIELDNEYTKKTDKYPVALRSKLRSLRYIKMFQKAKKDGVLDNLIAEIYFASSKINISDKDLSGPFIKIQ
tara:strand:- start:17 stop:1369 length:1353 start_codon:yes stop_codon:yes gene_type:complete